MFVGWLNLRVEQSRFKFIGVFVCGCKIDRPNGIGTLALRRSKTNCGW